MKVLIAGATGNIGGAALHEALDHPDVTTVVVLTRRELDIKNAKLVTIVKTDFTSYTDEELEKLKGTEAVVWALGTPTSGIDVHGTFPRAARDSFASSLSKETPSKKPFRFILVSGALVPRTENGILSSVPLLNVFQERGKVELEFEEFEHKNPETWSSIIVRPQVVVAPQSWPETLLPEGLQINKELFAAALVDLAVHGTEGLVLDNASLKAVGERAVARKTAGGLGAETSA